MRVEAGEDRRGLAVRPISGILIVPPLPRDYFKRRTPRDNPPLRTPTGALTVVLLIVAAAVAISLLVVFVGVLLHAP